MRVVVAEDNTLLREGVARLLEDAGMQVIGRHDNADALVADVREHAPDVAIVPSSAKPRLPPSSQSSAWNLSPSRDVIWSRASAEETCRPGSARELKFRQTPTHSLPTGAA